MRTSPASSICFPNDSLILHLLDSPEPEVIPDETIERAGRLTRFLLAHARDFYVTLPDAGLALTRDVAGWLLTKAPNRVRATDVASGVAGCRGMGSKRLTEALDPLVIGGWLEPEEPFPSNRAWLLHQNLRTVFAQRTSDERDQRAARRKLLRRMDGEQPK